MTCHTWLGTLHTAVHTLVGSAPVLAHLLEELHDVVRLQRQEGGLWPRQVAEPAARSAWAAGDLARRHIHAVVVDKARRTKDQ